MQIDYKDFTIKVFGIREYNVHIIFEGVIVLNRITMLYDLGVGSTYNLPIKTLEDGLQLAKTIIDRHAQDLKNRSLKSYPRQDRECRENKPNASKSKISKPKMDRYMNVF